MLQTFDLPRISSRSVDKVTGRWTMFSINELLDPSLRADPKFNSKTRQGRAVPGARLPIAFPSGLRDAPRLEKRITRARRAHGVSRSSMSLHSYSEPSPRFDTRTVPVSWPAAPIAEILPQADGTDNRGRILCEGLSGTLLRSPSSLRQHTAI